MNTTQNGISDTVHDKQLQRKVPDNGHALLLMQTDTEERTFSDYPNLVTCLDAITSLYEKDRAERGQDLNDYDIHAVWNYIDGFERLEVFIYDAEISRYKQVRRNELKDLFLEQIKKLSSQSKEDSLENGVNGNDDDDDDGSEDWDLS